VGSLEQLSHQLCALGVTPGSTLVVHTAFSAVGPIDDGPTGLIAALRAALGEHGTLLMPSMSDDDESPFDPVATPCIGMGIVAETFWRMPGVLRSDSPHAFAAIGPEAAHITQSHPVEVPHGPDSPVGRVHALDGAVLLIGAGQDANTMVHLAEELAGVRYRIPKFALVRVDGDVKRVDYDEIDHCCANFSLLDAWLESRGQLRRGIVGAATARLMRARDVVDAALAQLRADETVFLHPPGVCGECDEARASLPPRQ
jgi:aminoglycoside 3-N-acetyltransferase